jgi:hypothetical protein
MNESVREAITPEDRSGLGEILLKRQIAPQDPKMPQTAFQRTLKEGARYTSRRKTSAFTQRKMAVWRPTGERNPVFYLKFHE